ncbi:TonB-dependent receptor [Microscilla marina]|uniref:TonB-dependent receptor domain protein n=1 Tax=Microscilla marina ATCC 23134 TaxID=313606 RepID=A1ZKM5_MICM2|nr:TonB-dependent receptor [Microscilla marina]EAY29251.1 TonB-dependent receptor domain protein [Microscilla marina ATCC 23134]
MKNLSIYLWLLFTGWGLCAQAQNIQGKISDAHGKALPGATVVLVTSPDSLLAKFATTDAQGDFLLKKVKQGKYILQVSFTGFKPFKKALTIAQRQNYEVGKVQLQEDKALLDEVVVKDERIPIVIKKDTIEYNAQAFKTTPHSNVEKLLKQLPGIEVDRNGKIKAQGKEVQKVLVDGKEFFGKDPKIATKNLPADAIDKVQVFDDQSEMSKFTGVDDGNREKTINLKLKKNRKQGYFGNVAAGYGTNDHYKGKFNLHRFNATSQLSLLGTTNNINERPFSIMDYINFMGGLENLGNENGNLSLNGSSGLGAMLQLNNNQALATTSAAGANLNVDLNKRTSLHANYFFNAIRSDINQRSFRETFSDSSSFLTNAQQDQVLKNWNNRLNLRLDHKLSKSQRLRVSTDIMYNQGNNTNVSLSETTQEGVAQNNTSSQTRGNSQEIGVKVRALYRKRFNSRGRSLTLSGQFGLQNLEGNDQLNNVQTLLGLPSSTIRQRQALHNERYNYDLQAAFIEPLGKGKYLELKYQRNNYNNASIKDFYDISQPPQYIEYYLDSLSNRYNNDYTYDQGTLRWMYNRKNFNLTVGASTQYSSLNGVITTSETRINRHFLNVLPSLRFRWNINNNRDLNFNYRTVVQAPSMQQLQPVVDNSNPANIYQGNPNLAAEFVHRLGLAYYSFDMFSGTMLQANLAGRYTQNKITNKVSTDANLNQLSTPVNVAYDANTNGYLAFNTPLRWMHAKVNLQVNGMFNQGLVFINDVQNTIQRQRHSIDIRLENFKKRRMDIRIGAKFSQNVTTYSETAEFNRSFMQEDYYVQGDLDIGKTWNLEVSFTQSVYTDEAFQQGAQTVPVLRASIAKSMLKNRLQMKFTAFDILNRNQGIDRTSHLNYVEESQVQTIGRYFMVSVSYAINKMAKK